MRQRRAEPDALGHGGRALAFHTVLVLVMTIALFGGCKERKTDGQEATKVSGRPVVVCTTTMIADIAGRIGQDRVQVVGIMKPGMDPHSYEATPDDVIWFRKADLILYNGLHLEGRILDMIESSGSSAVALADDPRIQLRGKAGQDDAPDPHCWWNVKYFKIYVERAQDALISVDAAGAETYRKHASDFLGELDAADEKVRQAISQIPETQRVLVTSHDAFYYYGEAYGLTVDAVLGISTDAEVRALRAAELAQLVVDRKVPAVFHETSVSAALNQMIDRVVEIASREGHSLQVAPEPLYSDSLGAPGTPSGTYLGALTENTRIIVEALSGRPLSPTIKETEGE